MKKLPLFVAAILFAGAGFAQGARTYTLTDAEKVERDKQLNSAAVAYARTGKSHFSFWPSAVPVTAAAMREVYAANQIDGELRFKGKYVRIEGVITGFHSGIGDEPSVSMGDERALFGDPIARFPKEKASALAGLRKGQKVAFFCSASSVIAGVPFLRDCSLQNEVEEKAYAAFSARLDAFLAGKIADEAMGESLRRIRFASWPVSAPGLCVKKVVRTCPNRESVLYGQGKSQRQKGVDYQKIIAKLLVDSDESTHRILASLYTPAFADSVISDRADRETRESLKDVVY